MLLPKVPTKQSGRRALVLQKSGPSFSTRWGQICKFHVQHDALRLDWESRMVALRTLACSISHQVPFILAAKSIYNASPLLHLYFSSDLIHSPLDQGNNLLTCLFFFQSCSDCNHAPCCRLSDHFVQHIWSFAWQYFQHDTPVHLAHSFFFYIFVPHALIFLSGINTLYSFISLPFCQTFLLLFLSTYNVARKQVHCFFF